MPEPLVDVWEEQMRIEAKRAVSAFTRMLAILGERPFNQVALTPEQELQRLNDLMATDEDVALLASKFSFEQLIAMSRRRKELEERLLPNLEGLSAPTV